MSAATQARRIRVDAQDHFERTRLRDLIKPTRETLAKSRPDPLEWLHAKAYIGDEERDAGLEIRLVYAGLCGATLSRSGWTFNEARRRPGPIDQAPASKWMRLHHEHWLPWARDLDQRRPMLEITIDTIIDEYSFGEIDRRHRWKNGKAQDLVVEALGLYALLTKRGRT